MNLNSYFNRDTGEFTAPINGYYEFRFIARSHSYTCIKLKWTNGLLTSSCDTNGWIILSAITKMSKGNTVCVAINNGELIASSIDTMQFSGKYIGPS